MTMPPEIIWALVIGAALIVTAAAINRFTPTTRPRLRIIAILFVTYVAALVAYYILDRCNEPTWARRVLITTQVLRVLAVVSLAGTVVFRLALRGIGFSVPTIISDILVGVGYIVATVSILSDNGLDPVGAVATGAALSAILAFSLQSTLGNIIGGVALQLDGSIHEGDWIQLENGRQGRIRAIRWRHTLIETRDWSTIVVPNSSLLQTNFTILGYRDGAAAPQRMWVYFNVDFRYAPNHVIDVVTAGLLGSAIENVAADPKPNVVCMDFSRDGKESMAYYAVRYWLIDLATDDPTNSRVRARIFTALKRANIPLAVPALANLVQINDRDREHTHAQKDHTMRLAALKTIHLFQCLTEDEMSVLADGVSTVLYAKGETITRQGAVAHFLYVLAKGSVEVRVRKLDQPSLEPRVMASLEAPEVFGEMGLMTGVLRGADVVATSDCECYRVDKATFERILLARPEAAKELASKLATRRASNDQQTKMNDAERKRHHENEAARILGGIKEFFGL
ncbi:MAG TPA: mechanosensitive ion channel family protein [Kofleriaceae bacterium]